MSKAILGIIALSLVACGQANSTESSELGLSIPTLKRNQVVIVPQGPLQTASGCLLMEGMKLVVDQKPGSNRNGIQFRLIEEFKIPNPAMQWRFCKKDQMILVPFVGSAGDINGPEDPRTWGVMAQHQAKLKQDFFQAIRNVIQGSGANVMPGTSGPSGVIPTLRGEGQDRNKVIPVPASWERTIASYSNAKDLSTEHSACLRQNGDQWVVVGWMKDFKYDGQPIEVRSYKRVGTTNRVEDRCPDRALMFAVNVKPGKVSYNEMSLGIILDSIIEEYRIK